LTKYLNIVEICHKAKLQVFVKMQMTRNQPRAFQNRRIFQELNNVTLAELSPILIRQTLALTYSLLVESLHILFPIAVGLLQS